MLVVVSPGFIDLHQHGHDEENYRFKAMDGVTTALELEVGTGDVDGWWRRYTSFMFRAPVAQLRRSCFR
jgi:hypothetical protein